jgi:hypothetical protein
MEISLLSPEHRAIEDQRHQYDGDVIDSLDVGDVDLGMLQGLQRAGVLPLGVHYRDFFDITGEWVVDVMGREARRFPRTSEGFRAACFWAWSILTG